MMKRFFDILISSLALIAMSPVFFVLAILIRIDSPGSAFFSQTRIGRNGKAFRIFKFRTMIDNAEAVGACITSRNDSRITQVGRILRWFKLDELPQFWNVLKGDMSIVGPRPEVPGMVAKYSERQQKILTVRPGIIGASQVKQRDEEFQIQDGDKAEETYLRYILPKKLEVDLAYVLNPNPLKDLKILFGGSFSLLFSSVKLDYILESKRRFAFLMVDLGLAAVSFWLSFFLRFEGDIPSREWEVLKHLLPVMLLLRLPCFVSFGLYQTLWQYLGVGELIAIIKAVSIGSILIPFSAWLLQVDLPRSILVIDWFVLIMMLGSLRLIFKITAERIRRPVLGESRKNVLIVGTGDPAETLLREFIKRPELGYRVVGFVDDKGDHVGMRIHGIKVMGTITQLGQIIRVKKADEVIIALPESSGEKIREIMEKIRKLNLHCRILPRTPAHLPRKLLPLRLKEVEISDLLGRELVRVEMSLIEGFFRNKCVLITGAGGSIGGELVRNIARFNPKKIVIADNSESSLYEIQSEISKEIPVPLVVYLKDTKDFEGLKEAFDIHRPEIVYHAAAYKHVPVVEEHYLDGILNNVLGTKNVADLCQKFEVETFVLISTDKAICPRSIMGATKRIGELYAQQLSSGKTHMMAVRFGNVFNSRGSVVPVFKKQIEEGGPVTVTHPEVTRYFMDISEAVFLILQATIMGKNSEIFVLDMGQPIKIVELAKNLMQLMGVTEKQIPITFTGLRPGEKIHEELELKGETMLPTRHDKIKIWKPPFMKTDVASQIESLLESVQNKDPLEIIQKKLKLIVPEYEPWSPPINGF